jgi:hypothetical protein
MGRLRVPVSLLAMVVGGTGVLLGLVVLADFVMVGGLVVVVSGSSVMTRRLVMMLGRRMFSLVSHNRSPG